MENSFYICRDRLTVCSNISNGVWTRHVIADSFIPGGTNTMSPGTPASFYPNVAYANEILPDGR